MSAIRHQSPRLPDFIAPCLARLAENPPSGAPWVHEIKLDGYRLQALVAGDEVRLMTRNGLDWTSRFREIAGGLRRSKLAGAILDGEVIVEENNGVSNFARLVDAVGGKTPAPMVFVVFDLLALDGRLLTSEPLAERKARLELLIAGSPAPDIIRYGAHLDADGRAMRDQACRLGLEGIISKRLDRPYRSGRHGDWIKSKCKNTDEFVVAGFTTSKAEPNAVGALVVGYYADDRLVYAGRVGTGFDHATARLMWDQFQAMILAASPFAQKLDTTQRRGVAWLEPRLLVQVDYRGWTGDGVLRHAALVGFRDDKPANAVRSPNDAR